MIAVLAVQDGFRYIKKDCVFTTYLLNEHPLTFN